MAAARLPVVGDAIDDAVVAGFISYFASSNNASTMKGYARSVRQILGEGSTFGLQPGARLDDDSVQQAVRASEPNRRSGGYHLSGVRKLVQYFAAGAPPAGAAAAPAQQQKKSWDVKAIVAERGVGGAKRYRVRWTGYREQDDTWEPLSHLGSARAALTAYRRKQRAAGSVPGLAVGTETPREGARVRVLYDAPIGLQDGTVQNTLCALACATPLPTSP